MKWNMGDFNYFTSINENFKDLFFLQRITIEIIFYIFVYSLLGESHLEQV